MKRVLFINATDPLYEFENRYRPLWPCYLVAYLEKHLETTKDIEFKFMTGNFDNEMSTFKPHLVAISSVSQNYNYAIKVAAEAKQQGLQVVIGGFHISALSSSLSSHMDVGVIGEGETTFLELMRCYIESGSFTPDNLSKIWGVVYHENRQLFMTKNRPLCMPLDSIPHPKRSLIGYSAHDHMFTSRGCPYHCVFCSSSQFWNKFRRASPEYVIQEIQEMVDHGVKRISFHDDLFVADRKRLKNL